MRPIKAERRTSLSFGSLNRAGSQQLLLRRHRRSGPGEPEYGYPKKGGKKGRVAGERASRAGCFDEPPRRILHGRSTTISTRLQSGSDRGRQGKRRAAVPRTVIKRASLKRSKGSGVLRRLAAGNGQGLTLELSTATTTTRVRSSRSTTSLQPLQIISEGCNLNLQFEKPGGSITAQDLKVGTDLPWPMWQVNGGFRFTSPAWTTE